MADVSINKNLNNSRFDVGFTTSGKANLIENFNLLSNSTNNSSLLKVIYRYIEDFSRRRDSNFVYNGLTVTKKDDDTVTVGIGEGVIAGRWIKITSNTDLDIDTTSDGTVYVCLEINVTEGDTRDPANETFTLTSKSTIDDTANTVLSLAKVVINGGVISTVTQITHNYEYTLNYLSPRQGSIVYFYGGNYANRTEVFHYDHNSITFSKPFYAEEDFYPQGDIVVNDGGGAVYLSNNELKFLDNLNQYLTTTSDVTFKTITLGDNLNLNNNDLVVDGTHTIANSSLEYLVGLDQSLKTTDDVTFNSITTTSTVTLGDNLNLNNHNLVLDGSHTITNSSLEYLVGLNQSLKTTDNVTFNKLTLNNNLDLGTNNLIVDSGGDVTLSATELHYLDGLNQHLATTSDVTFNNLNVNENINLNDGDIIFNDGTNDRTLAHNQELMYLDGLDQSLRTIDDVAFKKVTINGQTIDTVTGGLRINAALYGHNYYPVTNNNYDIGNETYKWKALYVTTVYEDGTSLSSKYLGINAKAADSDKLDGHDSSYFATATHTHTYYKSISMYYGYDIGDFTFNDCKYTISNVSTTEKIMYKYLDLSQTTTNVYIQVSGTATGLSGKGEFIVDIQKKSQYTSSTWETIRSDSHEWNVGDGSSYHLFDIPLSIKSSADYGLYQWRIAFIAKTDDNNCGFDTTVTAIRLKEVY